jgi:type IV pilus assembly protein PilA
MRRVELGLWVAMLWAGSSWGQAAAQVTDQAVPQTARQALMEMFFSKTPGTFAKHLPAATHAALEKAGALASLQQYSQLMNQLQAQGQTLQTFETGSVLLTAEDPKTAQKSEVRVENDNLHGDLDDIELTFHSDKNGQEQAIPFKSLITFTMKQEAQVWTLNEISVTIHVPLADPAFLKLITEKMTPPTGALAPHGEVSGQATGSDAMVVAAMRTIITAEITYASAYPTVGFTCSLSSLDGFGGGEPNEHQAMLINSGLASGKRYGFVFTMSGCGGTPATRFQLTAAPNGNSLGRKAFCADQSGVIRSSADGNPATCAASGTAVQ